MVRAKDAGSKYSKTQLRTSEHWKVEVKSFPTVYNTPMLLNIGMSYTVGKLLTSTFQSKYGNLRTSSVLSPGVVNLKLTPSPFMAVLFINKNIDNYGRSLTTA